MDKIIIPQLFGIIGWSILLISYYKKDIDKLLIYQVLAGIFDAIHYFLLGAFSGVAVITLEIIRDYSYYKTDIDKYIFIISLPIYFLFGYISYDGLISLLPTTASIIDGYSLAYNRKTAIIGSIIHNTFWLIYDYKYHSYAGLVAETILIISNISILIREKNKIN